MTDLDFARTMQRLGLTVGDTDADPDLDPDIVWCDSGRAQIIPVTTYVKVADGSPVPWTGGNAVIECTISDASFVDTTGHGFDGAGYLIFNGKPVVGAVDLTSTKVNPFISDPDAATHTIRYINVMAGTTPVAFPDAPVRLTAAGDGISPDNLNDITLLSPVVPGAATPIYRGEQGIGIAGAAIIGGTNLQLDLSDGSSIDAGPLPIGPGGSDPGVGGYMANPDSDTSAATGAAALDPDHPLGAAIAELLTDIPTEAP